MFTKPLPRFVIAKQLAGGTTAFYFNVPTIYRKLGCTISNEALGKDYVAACGENGEGGRAASLNGLFDEWNTRRKGGQIAGGRIAAYGTIDWLFREYTNSKAYLQKVSSRSRPDYERTILLITDIVTKKGDRIGDRKIRAITPISADKIYEIICNGPRGLRLRQGEKAVALCRRAWRVVHRLYPGQFDRDVPNPWEGVTRQRRVKATKPAVLERLPRRGVPMILREVRDGITKPFSFSGMQKIVHTMRDKMGLPSTFTLDACRHGGMTELEEAELTDGQGRALSAHKSQQAYEGYAKRTMERALSATRKRHAHRLANAIGTNIQNERRNDVQNADPIHIKTAIK